MRLINILLYLYIDFNNENVFFVIYVGMKKYEFSIVKIYKILMKEY